MVTTAGDKLTDAEKARFANLKSSRNNSEKTGRIALIMIEFYKPLFEPLFVRNSKSGLGVSYIQMPRALHAELKSTTDKLTEIGFFNETDMDAEKVPVTEMDARAIFLYLALHDNHIGEYITIDAVDFTMCCFPSCLQYTQRENESGKLVKYPYISKINGFNICSKIKKTIVVFKQMGKIGKMDGGQFIPLKLDENHVQYNHEAQEYRIKILRPDNPKFPRYEPEAIT
jgi:hypothetical protein